MTIYTPNESFHLVDTKYAVIKGDLNRFCDEKQKRVQKRVQRVHIFCVLDMCTLLLFFVLEKSGHPDSHFVT